MKRLFFAAGLGLTISSLALEPLPSGHGLAKDYPGDAGIASHPAVLLAEDFEHGSLDTLRQRWNEVGNKVGRVPEFAADRPARGRMVPACR